MTISVTHVVVAAVFILGVPAVQFALRHRQPFLVQRWARDKGFRILECEVRSTMKGPFTGKTGRGQYVCHVRVRDSENRERSAWLRCTDVSIFTSDKTEVVWDTEHEQASS